MYHIEEEVNDRGKRMADRCLERMAFTVDQAWTLGR